MLAIRQGPVKVLALPILEHEVREDLFDVFFPWCPTNIIF